jgi:hypothetical protein
MFKIHAGRVSAVVASAFLASACGAEDEMMMMQPAVVEPTTFKVRLANVAPFTQLKSGVFNTRVGGTSPGPLAPGDAYEFSFTAGKGQKLSFAVMLGQSNDWIFAPAPGGLDLYENGYPVSGDVTSRIYLWDVGTELNEEPAIGAHTGPNQASSLDGPGALDPDPSVRKISGATRLSNGTWFNVPAVASMIRVTVTPNTATRQFTVRIQNVATDNSTLQTSQGYKPVRISPGAWALAAGGEPLFSEGQRDRGQGLEAIAEMGQVSGLAAMLASTTGLATPISPGVFLVSATGHTLFSVGVRDNGQGLERIAEDGNVMPLHDSMKRTIVAQEMLGIFNTPEGSTSPGPARPGSAYTFEVKALPGDRLSFVTMYGMSNDWFFGTTPQGIELFDAAGMPLAGDFSSMLRLYDAGTELSEEAGIGPNTGPQQAAANTGTADFDTRVRELSSSDYATPVTSHLKLTISR